ncbi:zinc finger protein 433-like isoform X1 [Sander lucioperca]|uniref:zinc finger protein 433-like isoform X1 n=1 Tax=Sander lucioperca TaxID=283035 RepID=UPI00125D1CF8|nr:zinc finger protein 433-like isoform X1 [Sander lucioperca]
MSQIEELKAFVSERLHSAASEILGAIEKTITNYEEQAIRLKEDNDRHRSLLDIIIKANSPQTEAVCTTKKRTPAAAGPAASDPSPARKARETHYNSSDLQYAFTSHTDFLKFAGNDDCPYCLKRIQATETHLMRRHYLSAVHFNEDGTEKFVVPCTCKDLIQGRSHWHCPYCTKIIYRKVSFEVHISKQHGYAILQQSHSAEIDQPSVSAFEEEVPLSPGPWCHQEFSSLDQEVQQASLLLQVKEEEEEKEEQEMRKQVSHPEGQNVCEQVQKGNRQMSLEADHAQVSVFNIVCVDSYIQDVGEINSAGRGKGHPPSNSSNQPLEMHDSGFGEIQQPAGESEHPTPCSSLKAFNSKRKKRVKRSLPPLSLNIQKSTQPSVSHNPTGPHCCKACGKTFHYMYTLRSHAQTHAVDKIHVCAICGKHLESTDSLVQHLQSHTKRNKCATCGKVFSNISLLKRHRRFHRSKCHVINLKTTDG